MEETHNLFRSKTFSCICWSNDLIFIPNYIFIDIKKSMNCYLWNIVNYLIFYLSLSTIPHYYNFMSLRLIWFASSQSLLAHEINEKIKSTKFTLKLTSIRAMQTCNKRRYKNRIIYHLSISCSIVFIFIYRYIMPTTSRNLIYLMENVKRKWLLICKHTSIYQYFLGTSIDLAKALPMRA